MKGTSDNQCQKKLIILPLMENIDSNSHNSKKIKRILETTGKAMVQVPNEVVYDQSGYSVKQSRKMKILISDHQRLENGTSYQQRKKHKKFRRRDPVFRSAITGRPDP